MTATMNAVDLAALREALTAMARSFKKDDYAARRLDPDHEVRTMDQARSDALAVLGNAALTDPALPEMHGRRPGVQVTVALSTLLGLDDQPAELAGMGPLPAFLARRCAADPTGTWRRLVTDPLCTTLLDYGRRTYSPPQDLADHVLTRDQTCVFPTCHLPAYHCDLDHGEAYDSGGRTDRRNLAPMCRRHHRTKHHGGWTVERTQEDRRVEAEIAAELSEHPGNGNSRADTERRPVPDGGHVVWTSPTGHRYRPQRPVFPIDLTADLTADISTDIAADITADVARSRRLDEPGDGAAPPF